VIYGDPVTFHALRSALGLDSEAPTRDVP
jgi:hypothetical protein